MADASTFDKIRIGIASPDQVRAWSYGEVKKPETINYRTFKPERDGLFCEKIFGPTKDWECHCGRYKKVKFKGIICDRCGVEVTRSKVRRERMGHIELAAPVCHIWYLKGVPSPLALLLDMTPRPLEKVLYFASYIVTSVDKGRIMAGQDQFHQAVQQEIAAIEDQRDEEIREYREEFAREIALGRIVDMEEELEEDQEPEREPYTDEEIADREKGLQDRLKQVERDATERAEELTASLELLRTLEKRMLITEDQWRATERLLDVVARRVDESMYDMVEAGLGGAAIKKLLEEIDLEALQRQLKKEVEETQGPRRLRSIKRIEVVNAFLESKARPEWMILDCVPVISPELRPMVQLDGGRFATSDLNDLYRRIINRNNRLKKITEIRAPESIVNHEKRLLQEAVDALIDNGRRTRPVTGSNGRPLKSLSDMLKGKEGRFRKNLLGKRVDYSGRSVIVVGPELKLHECGLPKEMALELFKPFVMKTLVERGYTSNIKTAKRMIDKMRPEVWDALEEVIREHPVLLNRAPTLHRLGIQAFEPKLVDGKAIQLHPLVCKAFNADFDGDQMAVHIPLSSFAQAEARVLMLSTHNLFSPADGSPIVSPQQDIVLGCYFLTMDKFDTLTPEDGDFEAKLTEARGRVIVHDVVNADTKEVLAKAGRVLSDETLKALTANVKVIREVHLGTNHVFSGPEDALHAYHNGLLDLHEYVAVRLPERGADENGARTLQAITAGRLLFNEVVPRAVRYVNKVMDKKAMTALIADCYETVGNEGTLALLDEMKALGFRWACKAGITFSLTDMQAPQTREEILHRTEDEVTKTNQQFRRGILSPGERKQKVLELWTRATADIGDEIVKSIDKFNPIAIMTESGARGSKKQISQLSGMRGLMADPFGNIIEDLPVKSNFHEGLSVLEYFVTTHGARKGLADTALRTADAGYLTRRLVDVAQDVIIREHDCGTEAGIHVQEIRDSNDVIERLGDRIKGRTSLEDIVHPETGEVIVQKNETMSDDQAEAVEKAGVKRVGIRSVLFCESRQGVCATCYGRDLATGRAVETGVAVGIIAAQSIGEPGTQLTMRTFHTGGVASANQLTGVANVKRQRSKNLEYIYADQEQGRLSLGNEEGHEREKARAVQALLKVAEEQVGGLLRVVELFEARKPKGQAIVTEFAGTVNGIVTEGLRRVVIHSPVKVTEDHKATSGQTAAEAVIHPETGEEIVPAGKELTDREARKIRDAGVETILVRKETMVPYRGELEVKAGDVVEAGHRLTEGPLDPQKVLELQGTRGLQEYLVREVQTVYKQQGVDINDKHVEVIIRQMLRKRKTIEPGDTEYLPGQSVDRFELEDANRQIEARTGAAPGRPATSIPILLGITEASLATESFLSAASFQKTTRVLTEAAVRGKRDSLVGLKENVIIGRLIPAGTGLAQYRAMEVTSPDGQTLDATPQSRRVSSPSAISLEGSADDLSALDQLTMAALQLGAEPAGGPLDEIPDAPTDGA